VIELVLYDKKDKSKQIAISWASIPLQNVKQGKNDLLLKGESPFLHCQESSEFVLEGSKQSGGLLGKLFDRSVKREIVINCKPFAKLAESVQARISLLPSNSIYWRNTESFVTAYKLYSWSKLS
jgi:hypothetical protein